MTSPDFDPSSILSQHPALLAHHESLRSLISTVLIEDAPIELVTKHVADLAISYLINNILAEDDALVGSTEAAPILGLTIQRTAQIADEGKMPIPIARVGGKRPVWLKHDVIIFARDRDLGI